MLFYFLLYKFRNSPLSHRVLLAANKIFSRGSALLCKHNVSMLSTPQIRYLVRHIGKRSITSSLNLASQIVDPDLPKSLKRPQAVRGGQNLSERFKRLENSLRGNDATLKRDLLLATKANQTHLPAASSAQTHNFHGFHVPQEPIPPADEGVFKVLSLLFNVNFIWQSVACRAAPFAFTTSMKNH